MSLASVVTVVGRIRITWRWVWRVLILVFPTLFLLIAFLFNLFNGIALNFLAFLDAPALQGTLEILPFLKNPIHFNQPNSFTVTCLRTNNQVFKVQYGFHQLWWMLHQQNTARNIIKSLKRKSPVWSYTLMDTDTFIVSGVNENHMEVHTSIQKKRESIKGILETIVRCIIQDFCCWSR